MIQLYKNNSRFVYAILLLFMLLGAKKSWGQSIFTNPITGINPNLANPYTTGQTVDANIAVSGIGRGSGITGANANDRYNANGWNSASFDSNDYYEFILTPNAGFEIDFVSFIYTGQRSGTGPTSFAFRSSFDSYTADIGTPSATGATISLSAAAYQNITTAITFRIYGWGASASGGTFSINDFTFNGTVSSSASCTPPTVSATGFNSTVTTNSMNIAWTNPVSGADGVIVVARSVSGVNQTPVSGTAYAQNSIYGSGANLTNGNFVVYTGTGNNVSITGLNPSTTYHYAIYTFSTTGLCYNTTNVLTGNATTSALPSQFYRSVQNGLWSDLSTWEASFDNTIWTSASVAPSSTSNGIHILTSHRVTISGVTSLDETTVSGTLVLNAGSSVITIADGTGTDLTINNGGVLEVAGTDITTTIFNGTVFVSTGGIIRYTSGGGSGISTVLAGTSLNTKIIYGDRATFDWNSTGTFNTSNINYFITSSNIDIPIFRISQNLGSLPGASNPTTINGILEVNGNITFDNAGVKIFRNGIIGTANLSQSSTCGQFIISGTTATIGGTGNISMHTNGMVANSGTSVLLSSNKTINGNASSNTFTVNGSIDCGAFVLSGSSTFSLANNATLITANTNGITGTNASSGSIQMSISSNEVYDAGANYVFNGSSNQIFGVIGNGSFSSPQITRARNITLNNPNNIVSLDGHIQSPGIIGVLSIPASNTLSMANERFIVNGGGAVLSIAGTVQTAEGDGFSGSVFSSFQGFSPSDIILGSNSIIHYNGGTQTVTNQVPYQNLLISITGSTDKTPSGNISVVNNLSILGSGGGVLVGGSNIFSIGGSWFNTNQANFSEGTSIVNWFGSGSQNINVSGGENFYLLSISGVGTLTANNAIRVGSAGNGGFGISSGTFDVGTNTLDGNANLTMTGGLLRLAKTVVSLPEITGTYLNSGGSIELYGDGSQILRGSRDYATIIISANSNTSITSAITSVAGLSITGNGVFNTDNFTFGSSATSLTMTGTSKLIVAGGGTKPDMDGAFVLGSGTTIEFTGTSNHNIRSLSASQNGGNYQNIIISGSGGTRSLSSSSTILRVRENFINNYIGTTTTGFNANGGTVSFTGTNQTIGGTNQTEFFNVAFSNSGTKSLTNGISVRNVLSLTGSSTTINATPHEITMLSDASRTARLAQVSAGCSYVGNMTMQRFMPGSSSRTLNYQLGSPVSGAAVSQWQPTNTPPTAPTNGFYITGNFTGKNVPANTGISAGSTASLLTFNSTTGSFNQFPLAANTESLTPGVGYRAIVRDGTTTLGFTTIAGKTLALTGSPTIGNFDFSLFYNTSNTLTSWNFIANPYPSEISADLTNATNYPIRTNVNPTAYVFNSVQGGYNTRNGAITILAGGGSWDGNVPSSQGFWVQINDENPALRVTEFAKSSGSSTLWREENPSYYRINLRNHLGSDEVVVRQSEDATYSFDNEFDARKLASPVSNGSPSLRIMSKENIGLVINAIPSDKKTPFDTLWLDYSSNSTLVQTITCYGFENFDQNTNVYLIDKALGKITDMKTEVEYPFINTITSAINSKKRFAIIHESNQTTNIDKIKDEKFHISVSPNPFEGNTFTIESSETLQPSQIEVFNTFGIKIPFDIHENRNNNYQITINETLKGILVLKINSSTTTIIKKLISK